MGLFKRVMLLVACHLASYEGRVQLGGAPMHIPAQRVDRDMSPGQGRVRRTLGSSLITTYYLCKLICYPEASRPNVR